MSKKTWLLTIVAVGFPLGAFPSGDFVDAKFGRGYLASRAGDRLAFATEGALSAERGTIELWVQIEDAGKEFEWCPLFVAQEPSSQLSGIILQLFRYKGGIAFLAGSVKSGLGTPIDWKRGEPHYVAATWGPDGRALYVDGRAAAESRSGPEVKKLPDKFSLGGFLSEKATNPAGTIIDELRISGRPKTAEETTAAFRSGKAFEWEPDTLFLHHLDSEEPAASTSARSDSPARTEPSPRPRESRGDLPSGSKWKPLESNPVLARQRPPAGLPADLSRINTVIWNDPSVLRQGSEYWMWASLGTRGPNGVEIYKLTSKDGIHWSLDNGGRSVLGPGGSGDFDRLGVETPAVIKVGSTYHLYYSAYKNGKVPELTMGHAVSPDGLRWEKKGELLSLTRVVGRMQGNPWGWLARTEPTAVHVEGTFYLYFTDVKCRKDDCKAFPPALRGISMATSRDGHDFQQNGSEPVALQSSHYPPEEGWEGYSTPWVLHDGKEFHLFVDAFRAARGGKTYQTALLHMKSSDGVRFEGEENDIVTISDQEWAAASVRAPTVLIEDGVWKMWYAGDNIDGAHLKPSDVVQGNARAFLGIGYAERR